MIFGKIFQMILCIPCGSKVLSKWLYPTPFLDKCVFAFYAEIQYGHQKWQENHFWQNIADDTVYTLLVKNFV